MRVYLVEDLSLENFYQCYVLWAKDSKDARKKVISKNHLDKKVKLKVRGLRIGQQEYFCD